jgi:hypothetical protein
VAMRSLVAKQMPSVPWLHPFGRIDNGACAAAALGRERSL